MAKVVWAVKADKDLDAILAFISKDSALYALNTIDKIVKRTRLLGTYSQLGRMVPEFNRNNIREILEGNYRIIYYLKSNHILISGIFHHSRLLKKL